MVIEKLFMKRKVPWICRQILVLLFWPRFNKHLKTKLQSMTISSCYELLDYLCIIDQILEKSMKKKGLILVRPKGSV